MALWVPVTSGLLVRILKTSPFGPIFILVYVISFVFMRKAYLGSHFLIIAVYIFARCQYVKGIVVSRFGGR
ncbi:hypothetical protein EPA93_46840 [Ktedonosporobacter rubrisoli]|uniref:Uncharacterized protein n=1 Tax=Ktedonosporobacter rubrisoli TaxID=2509675 RepID=A0A4P6K4T6_KTERU|nr:hypothetical protein [Ktedonosporobacter rubrisoli]QBD83085.1 hypothetical protein EPA93_46840 [Ktedonosporobacter rubrisoli]